MQAQHWIFSNDIKIFQNRKMSKIHKELNEWTNIFMSLVIQHNRRQPEKKNFRTVLTE